MKKLHILKRIILCLLAIMLGIVIMGISQADASSCQLNDVIGSTNDTIHTSSTGIWSEALLESDISIAESVYPFQFSNQNDYKEIFGQIIMSFITLLLTALVTGVITRHTKNTRECLGNYTIRYIHNSVGYLQRIH